jgi:hypothetical protein
MVTIKLISGWSNPGGGTIAHIGLTNLLNDNGYDCTYYGPHDWHLDKCKGGLIQDAVVTPEDIAITHFIQVPKPLQAKKHILSCHETNLFPVKQLSYQQYDVIHFVSNSQKKWHGVNHPSIVIPPVVSRLKWKNPQNNTAGVIGSIDQHKQTHLSIERALKDGYSKVLLFGLVTEQPYFNKHVAPHIESGKAILMGHKDDKEEVYNQVTKVYHTSLRETYGLVEVECKLANIPFNGPSNNQEIVEDEEIMRRWDNILKS